MNKNNIFLHSCRLVQLKEVPEQSTIFILELWLMGAHLLKCYGGFDHCVGSNFKSQAGMMMMTMVRDEIQRLQYAHKSRATQNDFQLQSHWYKALSDTFKGAILHSVVVGDEERLTFSGFNHDDNERGNDNTFLVVYVV